MACEVCCGEGTYPIINNRGTTLYEITCPECMGDGMTQNEAADEYQRHFDLVRYETAMAEKRASEKEPS